MIRHIKEYNVFGFLTVLLAVWLTCSAAASQDSNDIQQYKKEVLTSLEQRMQKKISVDFRTTPIEDVLRIMAEQADVDIVKSPTVTGVVTATLTDVPLDEALSNILTAHGYGYVPGKNMIRISPVGEITQEAERLISKIYRITYTDVKQVERALEKFISKRGSLSSNPGSSNIIVTDAESKIKAIDTFIDEIDRITPQIMIEVRIYDVTTDEDFDLGIEWNLGRNSTERRSLGSAVTVPDKTSFGVGMDSSPADATTGRTSKTRTNTPFLASSYDESVGGAIRLGLLNDAIDIDIALNILHKQGYAKLLANPRIMVLDNETADFEIVREIPYTEVSTTGDTATETIKFKPVGVKLRVTPHVTREGMLRLHILPEFGVRVGTTSPPTVDTRKVDTKALIKDNQTVVLGGLRKKQITQDTWKVPLLGDLPLLGELFRSETETEETSELLIFITPKIVVTTGLSEAELAHFNETTFDAPEKPDLAID